MDEEDSIRRQNQLLDELVDLQELIARIVAAAIELSIAVPHSILVITTDIERWARSIARG